MLVKTMMKATAPAALRPAALCTMAAKVGGPKLLQTTAMAAGNPAAMVPSSRLVLATQPRGLGELAKALTASSTLFSSSSLSPLSLFQEENQHIGLLFAQHVEQETSRRFKMHYSTTVLPELVKVANQWEDEQLWIKHFTRADKIGLFQELVSVAKARNETRLVEQCKAHFRGNVLVELCAKVRFLAKLSSDDRMALRRYTTRNFWTFNNALRNNQVESLSQEEKTQLSDMRKAFAKGTKCKLFQGEVYRGSANTPQLVYDSLVEGATFSDPAFLSTSRRTDVAAFFCQRSVNQDNLVLFQIQSKTGVNLDDFSIFDEAEVGFAPGTLFRIEQVDDNYKLRYEDGTPYTAKVVHMTEMV